uniref:Uncharacterized protein n=1 Tax=Aegilops tauschii TaxID=37682 RepID=N1QX66_AEGTA
MAVALPRLVRPRGGQERDRAARRGDELAHLALARLEVQKPGESGLVLLHHFPASGFRIVARYAAPWLHLLGWRRGRTKIAAICRSDESTGDDEEDRESSRGYIYIGGQGRSVSEFDTDTNPRKDARSARSWELPAEIL